MIIIAIVQWIWGFYSISDSATIPFYVHVCVFVFEQSSKRNVSFMEEEEEKNRELNPQMKKVQLKEIKLVIKAIKSNEIKTKRQIFLTLSLSPSVYLSLSAWFQASEFHWQTFSSHLLIT